MRTLSQCTMEQRSLVIELCTFCCSDCSPIKQPVQVAIADTCQLPHTLPATSMEAVWDAVTSDWRVTAAVVLVALIVLPMLFGE